MVIFYIYKFILLFKLHKYSIKLIISITIKLNTSVFDQIHKLQQSNTNTNINTKNQCI